MQNITHQFILRRRRKIVQKQIPILFGISGVARCGKDTLANYLINKFERMGLPCVKKSLSTAVKEAADPLLKQEFGISAFTEDPKEKELIRPLFVCLGTTIGRKSDPDKWINKLNPIINTCLDNKIICIVPDIRYKNEAEWIKSKGGIVIHITKLGTKPANFEEKINDPIVKKLADYKIRWKTFTSEKNTCEFHVNKLFNDNGWTTYGTFK